MVLRASGRLPDITRMYEAAAAAVAPRGGELALVLQHEVFGAHVREQNFLKQQQVALKLSKAAPAAATAVGCGNDAAGAGGVSGERYGWWVVLSILLQARAALRVRTTRVAAPAGQVPPNAMDPEKMLALAEGMVARQVAKDGRLEGYEALMVYVDVLLAQGKTVEALSLVSGPLGASALRLPAERLQLRAVLSALSGDLEAASELLREGLTLNPDDWGALLLLLDCMLPGTAASVTRGSHPLILISGGLAEQLPPRAVPLPPGECEEVEEVLPDGGQGRERGMGDWVWGGGGGTIGPGYCCIVCVRVGIVEMSDQASASGDDGGGGGGGGKAMTMRGPHLALVDLASRRHRAAVSAGLDGGDYDTETAVVDAVLSYYRKYGSLVSCAVDLRTYVSQLSIGAARRLEEGLRESENAAADGREGAAGNGGSAAAASLASLRRRVCAAQIGDDLGLPRLESCEEGVELSRMLLELYGTAQPLQAGLDERERGAADELPVLAAAALATSAGLANSDAAAVPYMLAAYGALSEAVRVRPYGAAMRISMAALASLLAAPAAAAAHMYKLDIKHIQMDTLGAHLLLPPLLTWPHGSAAAAAAATAAEPSSSGSTGDGPGHSSSSSSPSQQQQQQQLLQKVLKDTRALFDDHARDMGESLFTAYGHGMYTKVLEFTAFRERLAAAHTLALARAESSVLDCLRGAGGGGPAAAATAGNSGHSSSSSSATARGAGAATGAAAATEGLVTAEAMRTAAVAAAGQLNPDNIPSADTLRFNWDLSTRPTWLPPGMAGPSAAVLNLREAVGKLAGLMGPEQAPSPGGPSSAAASAASTAEDGGGACTKEECTTVGPIDLRRLDVKLYSAALALQVLYDSLARALDEALGGSVASLCSECERMGRRGSLLRHLAAVEVATLKVMRKRKAKGGPAPAEGATNAVQQHLQLLGHAVAAAAGELGAAAGELAAALTAALGTGGGSPACVSAAVEQAVRFLKSQGHAAAAVSESATSSLESLIREQRLTVASIARQAAALAAALR
ncbi:hypothetical protein VOLCADRAFT_100863 [Volvox carteri f. nagariensis]|uniref:Uncharacterized protein n=1 Tax=Volvox carteri f. nagariensis TaxID=3068 RepID=D8UL74_VOLCA|nr:uncharacterized protein VOLCADRAFT_100863 [Volvox carteri f. nagariensis]EFJ39524.1 hypothetical protein VOLCADRAFT_100863 [Volvox carteri f. nagariensis]|eukprot:XP_002959409.1 hypothetical protein VOLCADRAFT_100863 [Volvox carteri f. nagariensis]